MHLAQRVGLLAAGLLLASPAIRAQLPPPIWTCGSLGGPLGYDVSATPGSFAGLLPSFNSGPTPLALFDPADPRSLDVGLDLLFALQVAAVPPSGVAHFGYLLPAGPELAGMVFHAQAFDLPGTSTLIDELSPATTFVLAFAGTSHAPVGMPGQGRRAHSATTLASGQVLIAGGRAMAFPLASTELYLPSTQSFVRGSSSLPEPRSHHEASLLADGRVLVSGGLGDGTTAQASAWIYRPSIGTWLVVPPMQQGRVEHSSTLLADGRVLVVGGSTAYNPTHPVGWPSAQNQPLIATSELFDPATDSWQPGPSLPFGLTAHRAVLLGNGQVLVCGGIRSHGASPENSGACFVFDPATDSFSPAAPLPTPTAYHGASPSAEGGALIAGGGTINFGNATLAGSAATATYSPTADGWAVGSSLSGVVVDGTTICVPTKLPVPIPRYAVGGGFVSVDLLNGGAVAGHDIETLEPGSNQWTVSGSLADPSGGASLSPVHQGSRLLLVGAAGLGGSEPKAEVFVLE